MKNRRTESGNIFFALFGAVALIGVVGAATSTLMRGPLSTVVSVNQRAKADTQMQIASKLAMVRATQEVANGGDCDMDGTIEPIPPDAMTGATLVGGGALPASIGSSQIDPWNTRYGYCVWDLGAKVDDPACDSGSRLGGGLNESYPVMVIISAGPDKTFQTECNAWVGGGSAPYVPDNADVLVDRAKNTPNDDIVLGYTYSEAVQAAGGLWSLMSGDPDTITTDKNVAFSSGNVDFSSGTTANFQGTAQFAANSRLDLGMGGMFLLPDEVSLPTCNVANDATLRINKSSSLNVIEMCDPGAVAAYPSGWVPLGGAGATVAKIDDLTDAISYAGKGILFMGDGAGMSYSSTTGGMNNIGIGIGAASSLVTGAGNIVLGDHPLTAGTSNSIVLGNGVNGVVGNNALRLGNLLYGSNIYSSSGSLGIGGVPSATLDVNGPAEANRFQMDNNTYMGSVSSDMIWVTGGATNMMLNATGNLGIGATPTGSRLTVGGDAYVDGQTSSNNVIVRDNGSAGIPSLRFGSASGSGFYTNGGSIGFATGGNNRAWLNDNGFGIGTTPSVALDVVGQGVFTDRVTSTGFQFSSGQGMFPSGSGLSLNAGGTPQFYLSALGNVGIGVASPNTALDVDGAIRVGHAADSECDTARAGSIRYTSGDRLQICSDSTGDWETIGTSGGGGGGSGSYWSRVSTIDPRLYYTLGDVGVGVSDPLADFHVNGNLLTTGTFGSGDGTPVSGSGTRMMFVPRSGAFRAGTVTNGVWDTLADHSIGLGAEVNPSGIGSVAMGLGTTASEYASTAMGYLTEASGQGSTAIGSLTGAGGTSSVAMGNNALANGENSFAFGLGGSNNPRPQVSGDRSFGVFMGDQTGVNITTTNLMALLGGRMIIDPNPVSATNIVPSGLLTVDVQGDIGAVQYCDENGANCFTAGDIAGGGVGVWEDASNVIRLTSGTVNYSSASFVFGSPQLNHDGVAAHYSRFFFDKNKGAFRAGRTDGIYWDYAEMGDASIGLGYNTWAKGNNSIAIGHNMGVTGNSAIALGHGVDVEGENSLALGLGDASGVDPKITGAGSFGVFMGDQSNVNFSSSRLFGVFGGKMIVDPRLPATKLAPSAALTLNVEGQVGATEYCDQDGLNCFTAAGIGSAYGADGTIQFASAGKFHSNPDFRYDMTTNNVGIGNAAPTQKLHVTGKIRATQSLMLDPVAGAAPLFMNLTDLGDTNIGAASGGDILTYNSSTGRWVNSPAGSLTVSAAGANREVQFNNNGSFGASANFSYTPTGRLVLEGPGTNSVVIKGGNETMSGASNTILGRTGTALSTGNNNTLVGFNAGLVLTTGSSNTALGSEALATATGADNTALGRKAGNNITTGGGNIMIGNDVQAATAAGNFQLNIGDVITGDMFTGNIAIAGTAAFRVPAGATAQRPLPAVNGMLRYNSTNNRFEGYQNGSWQDMLSGSASGSFLTLTDTPSSYAGVPNQYVRVNSATNALEFTDQLVGTFTGQPAPSFISLNDLSDVNLAVAPTDGQLLRYDNASGMWVAGAAPSSVASAAGLDTQLQFNNNGVFGASSALTFTSATGAMAVGHSATIGSTDANGVLIAGTATGIAPTISSTGSDTNVSLNFATKGSGAFNFSAGTYNVGTFSAVNDAFLTVAGNTAGSRGGIILRNSGTNGWNIIANPSGSRLEFIFGNNVNASSEYTLTSGGNGYYYGTGALRLNAGSSAERPSSPSNGMLRYNSTSNKFEGYQGGAWQDILTGAASPGTFLTLTDTPSSYASAANQYVRVNAGTSALEFTDQIIGSVSGQPLPSFIDLNDLGDVDLTVAPTNGQVLKYDNVSGSWKAASAGAAAGGANTQIQYNNAGNLAGSPVFAFVSNEVVLNASSVNKPGVFRIRGAESPAANYLDAMIALESTASGDIWSQAIMSGQPGRVGDYVFAHYNGSTWAEPLTFAKNNRIGIFAVTPLASFDINTNDAMIVPRGTTAQQPSSPVNGMLRYNTTTTKFEGYQNGAWVDVVGGGGGSIDGLSDAATNYTGSPTGSSQSTGSMFLGGGVGATAIAGAEFNTALGVGAMQSLTTAIESTAFGAYALSDLTTGDSNTAFGRATLERTTTGNGNTAMGTNALKMNITGPFNVAMGIGALGNADAQHNVAIGAYALATNTSGSNNTAVGQGALVANTVQSNNTAIGREALNNNVNGSNNTIIGALAGQNVNTGGNIIIGQNVQSLSPASDNTLNIGNTIYGDLANDYITIGGSAAPVSKFIVSPPPVQTIGTIGYVEANACGTIKQITSASALSTNTDAFTAPTAAYAGCCMDVVNTGTFNITLVASARFIPASGANVVLGPSDAIRVCTNGTTWYQPEDKVAGGGTPAGADRQIQFNNAGAFGTNANFVLDATGKLGVGTPTPQSRLDLKETTGTSSYFRLRSDSSTLPNFSGSSSLNALSAGNTFLNVGMSTGPLNNTFNQGGSIIHGLSAAGANGWSPLYLLGTHGGSAPTTAAVTIGGQKHNGTNNRASLTGTEPILDIMSFYDTSSTYLAMRVQANGNLTVANNISYSGTLTDTSDIRLKTDIHPLRERGSMLEKINQIDTYSFRMKKDTNGAAEFGVMAQDMQKIFPELVVTDTSTPENYLSVNYIGLIAPLVEATKELKAENDNLKSQLNSLETKMASIEADMKGMKAHTGYGIGKAGFGLGMAGGLALMGGFGGVLLLNRRRKAA